MKLAKTIVPIASTALIAACGSSKAPSPQTTEQTQSSVGFQASLPGQNFTGNSVRICGSRTPPADGKYRCFNNLNSALDVAATTAPAAGEIPSGTPAAEDCPCFQFDMNGTLTNFFTSNPTTGGMDTAPLVQVDGDSVISNLCPSVDLPANASAAIPPPLFNWTFSYQLYTTDNCQGPILNDTGNPNNFVCFDSRMLNSLTPNASEEPLDPGLNMNHIICSTVNAEKSFDFQSCVESCANPDFTGFTGNTPTGPLSTCPGTDVDAFNCGCTGLANPGTAGTCECNGVAGADLHLPENCGFHNIPMQVAGNGNPVIVPCVITCGPPAPPTEASPTNPAVTQAFLLNSVFCAPTCLTDPALLIPGVGGALPTCEDGSPVTFRNGAAQCSSGSLANSTCTVGGLPSGSVAFPDGCLAVPDPTTGETCVVQCPSPPPPVTMASASDLNLTQRFLLNTDFCSPMCQIDGTLTPGVGGALPTCSDGTAVTFANGSSDVCSIGVGATDCIVGGLPSHDVEFPSGCGAETPSGLPCFVRCSGAIDRLNTALQQAMVSELFCDPTPLSTLPAEITCGCNPARPDTVEAMGASCAITTTTPGMCNVSCALAP